MTDNVFESEVEINDGNVSLKGSLIIPESSKKLVIFAHGSGSSRLSPRNTYVAKALNRERFSTLLFDLLTEEEEKIDIYTREFRFDIQLLANRLINTTQWVEKQNNLKEMSIGYFGSSTGAAAALVAAAKHKKVKTVVSRGGRPDLAGNYLKEVDAATLLIVGEFDFTVIDLNHQAMKLMHQKAELAIIPGATHLFEEPGTLDMVIEFAVNWFQSYL